MFFANEQRESVREENPGIAFGKSSYYCRDLHTLLTSRSGQVGKVLGERWKSLSPQERQPYEDKAKADKERYDAEKQSYAVSTPRSRSCELKLIGCKRAEQLTTTTMMSKRRIQVQPSTIVRGCFACEFLSHIPSFALHVSCNGSLGGSWAVLLGRVSA